LRHVLTHLYDPSVLRASPLIELMELRGHSNTVWALQRALTETIEAFRPAEGAPSESRGWRIYQILHSRYVEQTSQREVADDLGLSIRQLRREELSARDVLADHLWKKHSLQAKLVPDSGRASATGGGESQPESAVLSMARELERARESIPAEPADIGFIVRQVLDTARPLLLSWDVTAESSRSPDMPLILLQYPILRQALLHIVSKTAPRVAGGRISIAAEVREHAAAIRIEACADRAWDAAELGDWADSLKPAQQLLALCGGSLSIPSTHQKPGTVEAREQMAFTVRIELAPTDQALVLAIDDNADALQLFSRYLSGSCYQFAGAQDARDALEVAVELSPQIILLDVMMPDEDGWVLLEKLREHPKTRDIPVIVCTILAQKELAFALGAAGFIQKPVSADELLSALDAQMVTLRPESG
jgi:CheY-like chemotaxis protein